MDHNIYQSGCSYEAVEPVPGVPRALSFPRGCASGTGVFNKVFGPRQRQKERRERGFPSAVRLLQFPCSSESQNTLALLVPGIAQNLISLLYEETAHGIDLEKEIIGANQGTSFEFN